jgi:peptidoglycan/xylan/chitin deacetylase (PgdA/CDA1 family)
VALTFDDGPSRYSAAVLAALQDWGARAAFFLIGRRISWYPETVRAEAETGNLVGNHTLTHPRLTALPTPAIVAQLEQAQRAVEEVSGVTPRWFRPPFGSIDGRVFGIATSLGLVTVSWSVDPRDYEQPGAESITRCVLSQVRPGSIILLHDGGGDRRQTVEALPEILAALRSRGYQFALLDELYS